jgi:hypothetical protein
MIVSAEPAMASPVVIVVTPLTPLDESPLFMVVVPLVEPAVSPVLTISVFDPPELLSAVLIVAGIANIRV